MSLIKLEKINKIYSPGRKIAFHALVDINLEIQKGEMVAITGPSGSGKSTLMNIIGLLDRPTSGHLLLDDEPISLNMPDRKLAKLRNQKVGFVFQTFNLLPRFSVLENVILPTIYGRRSQREKAEEILNKVGLGERIRYRPPELSGGEKQRVAIARALICEPEIILADEPTGNLDSATGQGIIDLLKSLNSEGRTIIIVTHDEKIAAACDRRIKLLDGKIVADERQNTPPLAAATATGQEEMIRPIPDDQGVHFVQLH